MSNRKPRAPYVAPDPSAFPLPTERDFPALCSYLERDIPTPANKDRVVRHFEGDIALPAVDDWMTKRPSFDPDCIEDDEKWLQERQVRWLIELLAHHYQSPDTAERKATRLGLMSARDYYRKVDLAHGVVAAGVLGATLPRQPIPECRAPDANLFEDDYDDRDEKVDDEEHVYLGVDNAERAGMSLLPTDRPDDFDDFDDSTPLADERDDASPGGSDDY